jgi:hypothetical protein
MTSSETNPPVRLENGVYYHESVVDALRAELAEAHETRELAIQNGAHNVDVLHQQLVYEREEKWRERDAANAMMERAEAAEAREQQLRKFIDDSLNEWGDRMPAQWRVHARAALASAAAADNLDSCPHCGLKGKPFCWCGEHAPELALDALAVVLHVRGSWERGYEPLDRIDPVVMATPEEWANAAHALCVLHRLLARAEVCDE